MLKVHHWPRRRLLHRLIEGSHQLNAGPLLGLKGVPIVVEEIAPGVDLQKDVLDQMDFTPIVSENLKLMDERIFRDEKIGFSIK